MEFVVFAQVPIQLCQCLEFLKCRYGLKFRDEFANMGFEEMGGLTGLSSLYLIGGAK